jgi:hypothetical protein
VLGVLDVLARSTDSLRPALGEGRDPFLWNASTVLTLLIGVVTMAVAVFAFTIVVTVFFLEPPVYSSDAATWPGFVDHERLAWLATGCGLRRRAAPPPRVAELV